VLPVRERGGLAGGVGAGLSPDRMLSAFMAGPFLREMVQLSRPLCRPYTSLDEELDPSVLLESCTQGQRATLHGGVADMQQRGGA
jgi:hypothetical protein